MFRGNISAKHGGVKQLRAKQKRCETSQIHLSDRLRCKSFAVGILICWYEHPILNFISIVPIIKSLAI